MLEPFSKKTSELEIESRSLEPLNAERLAKLSAPFAFNIAKISLGFKNWACSLNNDAKLRANAYRFIDKCLSEKNSFDGVNLIDEDSDPGRKEALAAVGDEKFFTQDDEQNRYIDTAFGKVLDEDKSLSSDLPKKKNKRKTSYSVLKADALKFLCMILNNPKKAISYDGALCYRLFFYLYNEDNLKEYRVINPSVKTKIDGGNGVSSPVLQSCRLLISIIRESNRNCRDPFEPIAKFIKQDDMNLDDAFVKLIDKEQLTHLSDIRKKADELFDILPDNGPKLKLEHIKTQFLSAVMRGLLFFKLKDFKGSLDFKLLNEYASLYQTLFKEKDQMLRSFIGCKNELFENYYKNDPISLGSLFFLSRLVHQSDGEISPDDNPFESDSSIFGSFNPDCMTLSQIEKIIGDSPFVKAGDFDRILYNQGIKFPDDIKTKFYSNLKLYFLRRQALTFINHINSYLADQISMDVFLKNKIINDSKNIENIRFCLSPKSQYLFGRHFYNSVKSRKDNILVIKTDKDIYVITADRCMDNAKVEINPDGAENIPYFAKSVNKGAVFWGKQKTDSESKKIVQELNNVIYKRRLEYCNVALNERSYDAHAIENGFDEFINGDISFSELSYFTRANLLNNFIKSNYKNLKNTDTLVNLYARLFKAVSQSFLESFLYKNNVYENIKGTIKEIIEESISSCGFADFQKVLANISLMKDRGEIYPEIYEDVNSRFEEKLAREFSDFYYQENFGVRFKKSGCIIESTNIYAKAINFLSTQENVNEIEEVISSDFMAYMSTGSEGIDDLCSSVCCFIVSALDSAQKLNQELKKSGRESITDILLKDLNSALTSKLESTHNFSFISAYIRYKICKSEEIIKKIHEIEPERSHKSAAALLSKSFFSVSSNDYKSFSLRSAMLMDFASFSEFIKIVNRSHNVIQSQPKRAAYLHFSLGNYVVLNCICNGKIPAAIIIKTEDNRVISKVIDVSKPKENYLLLDMEAEFISDFIVLNSLRICGNNMIEKEKLSLLLPGVFMSALEAVINLAGSICSLKKISLSSIDKFIKDRM